MGTIGRKTRFRVRWHPSGDRLLQIRNRIAWLTGPDSGICMVDLGVCLPRYLPCRWSWESHPVVATYLLGVTSSRLEANEQPGSHVLQWPPCSPRFVSSMRSSHRIFLHLQQVTSLLVATVATHRLSLTREGDAYAEHTCRQASARRGPQYQAASAATGPRYAAVSSWL